MFRVHRFYISSWLTLFLAPFVIASGVQAAPTVHVDKPAALADTVDIHQKAAVVTGRGGIPVVAFYGEGDLHNTLQVTKLESSPAFHEIYRLAEGPNVVQGISLDRKDDQYHLVWRPKLGTDKYVYYAHSDDGVNFGKPLVLNRDKSALLPLSIQAGDNNLVAVSWIDERSQDKPGSPHHVYLAISNDGGRTFMEDINVTAEYDGSGVHTMIVSGSSIRFFFVATKGNSSWLVTRWTNDTGKTWSETRIQSLEGMRYTPVQITPVQTSWVAEGADVPRLLLFWGAGKKGLAGALSDDDGLNWKQLSFPDDGTDEYILSIDAETGKDGKIYLVDGVAFPQDPNKKADSFFHVSKDAGGSWDKRQRISNEPHNLTMNINPRIGVDKNGMVTVVWQDYRHIRSDVFLKASVDAGASWTEDTLLEEDGKYSSLYPRLISRGSGSYDVLYIHLDNDLLESGGLWYTHVDLKP